MESDLNAYKRYEQKCRELENVNSGLGREVERLNGVVRNNSVELNDYRQRFRQM